MFPIVLTNIDGDPITVNFANASSWLAIMHRHNLEDTGISCTMIDLDNGLSIWVKETPEQINAAIAAIAEFWKSAELENRYEFLNRIKGA